MKVVFRVDASMRVGSGHVVRCMTLADELRALGAQTHFLCASLPPHLRKPLQERGHQVIELSVAPEMERPAELAWPQHLAEADVADSHRLTGHCDALVVDHYGLGAEWETCARSFATRVLAIDDLGRSHDCDLVLDSNLYPQGSEIYAGRVPEGCTVLTGPAYAPLRPEFADAHAVARPRDGEVRNMLVFMSGMDSGNSTGRVLDGIAALPIALRPQALDVVIGPSHPKRAEIESACASIPGAQCIVGTEDMAGLCLRADLAVGAGGSATWERCCVGLPAIALQLAENQAQILHNGSRAGMLYALDDPDPDTAMLALHLEAVIGNSGLRHHISSCGLALVDGLGARRVAEHLLK